MTSKTKYKVLHFISQGTIGGMEKAIYQLLKTFKDDNDFEFGVVMGTDKGLYAGKIKDLRVPVICLESNSGFRINTDRSVLNKLQNYHIHHFHDPSPNQIILSLLSGGEVKRAITRRGGFIDFKRYGLKKRLKYFLNKILVRRYFHGFSGNTKHATEFIRQFYGISNKKMYVLNNGIDFELMKPTLDKNAVISKLNLDSLEFKIGTACHLISFKRVDLIIRAFSRCNINRKKLIIFGRGQELHNLNRLTKSLNLSNHVIFAGEVPNMSDYMQMLDCFILASDNEESFGNAIVEAMYLKIPSIIMNDNEGLKEHIVDRKTGFVAEDEADLIHKIEYIFNNPQVAKKIAVNASRYVLNKYSIENMINAYKSFYFNILNETNL